MKKSILIIFGVLILLVLVFGVYFLNRDINSGIEKDNVDLSNCLSLQGENKVVYSTKAFECWTVLAKENKNITICEAGFKEKYLQSCYENVSQYFDDVSMCDGLASVEVFENYNPADAKVKCYVEFAYKKDWSVCDNPFLKSYKTLDNILGSDFCYLIIVSRGNNLLGKKLTDTEITNLCNKINDESLSKSCLNYIGNPWQIPN